MRIKSSMIVIASIISTFILFMSCSEKEVKEKDVNEKDVKAVDTASNIMPASANEIRPLLIGAGIPDVALTTTAGEPFDFKAVIATKPTILIFYRGGW